MLSGESGEPLAIGVSNQFGFLCIAHPKTLEQARIASCEVPPSSKFVLPMLTSRMSLPKSESNAPVTLAPHPLRPWRVKNKETSVLHPAVSRRTHSIINIPVTIQ